MNQELFDWILLITRWLHITTAVVWIGTSIFFMWLDRSFLPNPENKSKGYLGELWMIHGGGFYKVEKLQMGPTQVPERLHWFKWESYWTWMSGMALMALVFYTGNGLFLIDEAISKITFSQGILISLFSIFASWFVYDFLWEAKAIQEEPLKGHALTILWLSLMSFFLCQTLSGRAAYMHIGAMIGTWMAGNVFMRIIPRQVKMVEATNRGESINPEWSKNAKNRSTHNTYFTLPIIFIMISNHFPLTYGSQYNWVILLVLCIVGASIRESFIIRKKNRKRSLSFALLACLLMTALISLSSMNSDESVMIQSEAKPEAAIEVKESETKSISEKTNNPIQASGTLYSLKGVVNFEGVAPKNKTLTLPQACSTKNGNNLSNEILINNGHIQNVLVQITKGHEALDKGNTPNTPIEIDQVGCLYNPRLSAARVGQEVIFINSDPTFHNVRSFSKENQNFNLSMPVKNQKISKRFTKPELFLETKCSIHPWMSAYIAVMDHPYYQITDANGNFEIKGLPSGTYTLEAWHEIFGKRILSININEKDPEPLTIVFKK